MFKFDREKLSCRYDSHYTENQSPFGSGLYWPMESSECVHPEVDNPEWDEKWENSHCDNKCAGYSPVEIDNCPKHGEFIKGECCEGCVIDSEIEAEKMAKEYFGR